MANLFLAHRPRRMRKDTFSRRLMCEHVLTSNDLIYPVFVLEGENKTEAVQSMPGVQRQTIDLLLKTAAECVCIRDSCHRSFPCNLTRLEKPKRQRSLQPQWFSP